MADSATWQEDMAKIKKSDGYLFHIERSKNKNVVVYHANLISCDEKDKPAVLDSSNPIGGMSCVTFTVKPDTAVCIHTILCFGECSGGLLCCFCQFARYGCGLTFRCVCQCIG